MPPVHPNLDVNVLVSVSKRFIKDKDALRILKAKHDWGRPGLSVNGKTVNRATIKGKAGYEVILDEVLVNNIKRKLAIVALCDHDFNVWKKNSTFGYQNYF
jgi:hypothetical protein